MFSPGTLAVLDEAFANLALGHYWLFIVGTLTLCGLRSIGKGGAGQGSSLRSLPCHKLRECFAVFNKPCTVLTHTNNAHFFSKIIYSKLLIKMVKNHQT